MMKPLRAGQGEGVRLKEEGNARVPSRRTRAPWDGFTVMWSVGEHRALDPDVGMGNAMVADSSA